MPAPKANFVKVVINGESWGIYVNAQQFNKDFLSENFAEHGRASAGRSAAAPAAAAAWNTSAKTPTPTSDSTRSRSADGDKAWKDLIALCKTLNETPPDQLEEALEPILDIDGALWFLALDNALINGDGYWIRASDYSIYRDTQNKFHILPTTSTRPSARRWAPAWADRADRAVAAGAAQASGAARGLHRATQAPPDREAPTAARASRTVPVRVAFRAKRVPAPPAIPCASASE